ncbi:MAG TPA: hypothetical protein VM580_11430 [Labilithrix sp.]|nr:hypothetical protein [Labilithrix sp.]
MAASDSGYGGFAVRRTTGNFEAMSPLVTLPGTRPDDDHGRYRKNFTVYVLLLRRMMSPYIS